MKILVVGKEGQVARCLADKAPLFPKLELTFAGRSLLDLSHQASIITSLDRFQPDLVINAAAYTAVDKAEDEPILAMSVNALGPGILAREASKRGAGILHISTDYVFDGEQDRPYKESDSTSPLGVYGRTKLAGEEAVREANPDHTILRTAWVFSPYGNNFVKTMLRLARDLDELSVVDDQYGNPTSAHDIATVLLSMANERRLGNDEGCGELYHFAGGFEASWCGFAREVFRISKELGNPTSTIVPIPTEAYPTKAKRPKNSRLDCSKLFNDFELDLDRRSMISSDIIKSFISE